MSLIKDFRTPRLGILGSGQLARMLAIACEGLGVEPVVFSENKNDPASKVCATVTSNLSEFLSLCDVVTIENEFINLDLANKIESIKPLYPDTHCLKITQDKLEQKKFLKKYNFPTTEFIKVNDVNSFVEAKKRLGSQFVLKTRRLGYDGKGTFFINSPRISAESFFDINPQFDGYAEKYIDFKTEIAVIVARSQMGQVEAFPFVESKQINGVCNYVLKPEIIKSSKISEQIQRLGIKLIKKLNLVGVLGIELFLDKNGNILINELAPRVHNTGHITLDACNVSQFEQHIRAVLGYKLIKPKWIAKKAAMLNILGEKQKGEKNIFTNLKLEEQDKVYWYFKNELRQGRKLGHINVVSMDDKVNVLKRALNIRKKIKV